MSIRTNWNSLRSDLKAKHSSGKICKEAFLMEELRDRVRSSLIFLCPSWVSLWIVRLWRRGKSIWRSQYPQRSVSAVMLLMRIRNLCDFVLHYGSDILIEGESINIRRGKIWIRSGRWSNTSTRTKTRLCIWCAWVERLFGEEVYGTKVFYT